MRKQFQKTTLTSPKNGDTAQNQSQKLGGKASVNVSYNSKFIAAQQQQQTKPKAIEKQRYLFSPAKTKPVDLQKNAWERLLERSFDVRSIQLIKDQKTKIETKKQQSYNKVKAYTNVHSPRNAGETQENQYSAYYHLSPQGRLNNLETCQQQDESSNSSTVMSSTRRLTGATTPNRSNIWKQLFDKTSDGKVQKSEANYSSRRTVENFLSGRTVNPSQFSSLADIQLVKEDAWKEKAMKKLECNQDSISDITGCSKKLNPRHNKHSFKLLYNGDELASQNANTSARKERDRSSSNMQSSLVPNENSATYLGSSTMNCLLQDKVLGSRNESQTRSKKNEFDFKSKITCLSSERLDTSEANCSTVKIQKHLMTSFQNGTADVEKQPRKKNIQMPYQSRQLTHQLMSNNTEQRQVIAGKQAGLLEKERSKSSRPQGMRNMFESQLTILS